MINHQHLEEAIDDWCKSCQSAEKALMERDAVEFWQAMKCSRKAFDEIRRTLVPPERFKETSHELQQKMRSYSSRWDALREAAEKWRNDIRNKIHGRQSKRQITYAYNHTARRSGHSIKITVGGRNGS